MRKLICVWMLTVLTPHLSWAAVTNVFTAAGTQVNLRIPAQGEGGTGDPTKDRTQSQISVSGLPSNYVITDIEATVTINHPFTADLVIELVSPSGYSIVLADRRGSQGDNYAGTTFDDEASLAIGQGSAPFSGRFRPESPMSDFDGTNPNGTWTLRVEDMEAPDIGTLVGWSLRVASDVVLPPVSVEDAGLVEGNSGDSTVTVLVRLGGASPVPVSVAYSTADATAVAGMDYVAASGTLTFNAGEQWKVLSLSVRGDLEIEGTESFLINLSNPSGLTVADGQARVAILNDDPTGSTRTFQAGAGQVGLRIPPAETGGTGDPVKDTTRSQITISGQPDDAVVADLDVTVSWVHAYDQDVVLRLVSPAGTRVLLSDQRGWGGTNSMAATFDDQAALPVAFVTNLTGRFRPEEALFRTASNRLNGTWILEVEDVGFGDTGTLSGWSMRIVSIRTNALAVPAIDVALNGTSLLISWPDPSPASALEATPSLSPAAWSGTGLVPSVVNGRNTVTVPANGPERYFRLRMLQ